MGKFERSTKSSLLALALAIGSAAFASNADAAFASASISNIHITVGSLLPDEEPFPGAWDPFDGQGGIDPATFKPSVVVDARHNARYGWSGTGLQPNGWEAPPPYSYGGCSQCFEDGTLFTPQVVRFDAVGMGDESALFTTTAAADSLTTVGGNAIWPQYDIDWFFKSLSHLTVGEYTDLTITFDVTLSVDDPDRESASAYLYLFDNASFAGEPVYFGLSTDDIGGSGTRTATLHYANDNYWPVTSLDLGWQTTVSVDSAAAPVPEPATIALFSAGLLALVRGRRRAAMRGDK